mmetsp:Transcript_26337/g.83674  ORF Transcript_26337/g.83674 Transcript_26337/m.83674 type:complete len:294 (-) Transcript_26337:20-901(-)
MYLSSAARAALRMRSISSPRSRFMSSISFFALDASLPRRHCGPMWVRAARICFPRGPDVALGISGGLLKSPSGYCGPAPAYISTTSPASSSSPATSSKSAQFSCGASAKLSRSPRIAPTSSPHSGPWVLTCSACTCASRSAPSASARNSGPSAVAALASNASRAPGSNRLCPESSAVSMLAHPPRSAPGAISRGPLSPPGIAPIVSPVVCSPAKLGPSSSPMPAAVGAESPIWPASPSPPAESGPSNAFASWSSLLGFSESAPMSSLSPCPSTAPLTSGTAAGGAAWVVGPAV